MVLKLVIFDLDGLMMDSERFIYDTWSRIFSEFGRELKLEDYTVCLGHSEQWCAEYAKSLCPELEPDELLARTKQIAADSYLRGEVPAKKGLYGLLDFLDESGTAYCVGSSNSRENVMASLACMKLDPARFKDIITGNDVKSCKPEPDIFLECARRCGARPEDCLVLEDSSAGVLAAHAAGMRCVLVPDLLPPTDEIRALAYREVPSLEDVPRLVGEL